MCRCWGLTQLAAPSILEEAEFYIHFNGITLGSVMHPLSTHCVPCGPSPLPPPHASTRLLIHLLVTIKVFHTPMLLIKKLQRKKINGVPRTMGFTALPCILLSRSCWTSRMFTAYWDSILAPPGRQASWETEVLSYRILMVSKNHHSRVLFHLQPERNLDLGSNRSK